MVIVSLDSKLSQNWCGPKARSRRTLTTWCECKPGVGCAAIGAARAVRRLVQRARLAPACPSARTARKGLPMPRRASHCAHRRRQDVRRFPAEPYRSRAPGVRPKAGTRSAINTLYVSPLKALAVDIARNLATPIEEMGLPIRLETRTGDTLPSRRARQRISTRICSVRGSLARA